MIDHVLHCIGIKQLTSLRSLTLHQVSYTELQSFHEKIMPNTLTSLSIERRNFNQDGLPDLLIAAINQPNLRKLCLMNFKNFMQHSLWPAQNNVKHLTIDSCLFEDYPNIFQRMPQLRELVVGKCQKKSNVVTTISNFNLQLQPQLVSLTINKCDLSISDLEALISMMPGLYHLKLTCDGYTFQTMSNAAYWERFISYKLPLLKNFEFSFSCQFSEVGFIQTLSQLIAYFQTSYWLRKRWFVTCGYDINAQKLRLAIKGGTYLHTSTKCERSSISSEKPTPVFKLSSEDNICKLTELNADDQVREARFIFS